MNVDYKEYKDYCFIRGTENELKCKALIESLNENYKMEKTETYEDCKKHIDFRLWGLNNKLYIFDFKGDKEGHKLGFNGYTWIETKNVDGNIGWFYAKMLNSLMFELPDRYILIDIFPLRDFCKKTLELYNETSITKPIDDYILYQRYDRFDEMFRMPLSEISKYLIHTFMKK